MIGRKSQNFALIREGHVRGAVREVAKAKKKRINAQKGEGVVRAMISQRKSEGLRHKIQIERPVENR